MARNQGPCALNRDKTAASISISIVPSEPGRNQQPSLGVQGTETYGHFQKEISRPHSDALFTPVLATSSLDWGSTCSPGCLQLSSFLTPIHSARSSPVHFLSLRPPQTHAAAPTSYMFSLKVFAATLPAVICV